MTLAIEHTFLNIVKDLMIMNDCRIITKRLLDR